MDYDNVGTEAEPELPDSPYSLMYALVAAFIAALAAIAAAEFTGNALSPLLDEQIMACQRTTALLAHALNGGALEVEGATHVSCKAKTIRSES
jgi:hypothetical protein